MIIDNANAQTVQLRTDNFKPFIHYNGHKLLYHTTWLEENIVADNLKEKIGNVSKIKQVTRQYKSHASKRSSSLLGGRGGDHDRDFHKRRHCHPRKILQMWTQTEIPPPRPRPVQKFFQQRTPLQVFCAPPQHKNVTFADFLTIPLCHVHSTLWNTFSMNGRKSHLILTFWRWFLEFCFPWFTLRDKRLCLIHLSFQMLRKGSLMIKFRNLYKRKW